MQKQFTRLILFISVIFVIAGCSSGSKDKASSSTHDGPRLAASPPPNGCSNCILISEIPVLDSATFPFGCESTKNKSVVDRDKSYDCRQWQFLAMRESFNPNRRNSRRDDGSNTHYPYYPSTQIPLRDNENINWFIFTEYATDELIQSMSGGLTYTDGLGNRAYHTGEDWNLSTGGNTDSREHLYSIGKGIVAFRGFGSGFGNTIQIIHKICPNRDSSDSSKCELVLSHYSHMNSEDFGIVSERDRVVVGQVIGRLGSTETGGAHLHLELRTESFLERIRMNGTTPVVDESGEYVRLKNSGQFSKWKWPGLNVAFIREHYYDPTEFIKENAGIRLLNEHYVYGSPTNPQTSRTLEIPREGIVVVELTYPPGQPGNASYTFSVESNNITKLIGNTRPLDHNTKGERRAVLWGGPDGRPQVGDIIKITPEIVSGFSDAPNTPFNLKITLYPYSGIPLAKTYPVPARPLAFDSGDVASDSWYRETVYELYNMGVVGGFGREEPGGCPNEIGNYCPEREISRVEFFTILMQAINADYRTSYTKPSYIPANTWYTRSLVTAHHLHVINPITDPEFVETEGDASWREGAITRREVARYISRAFDLDAPTGFTNPFSDIQSTDDDYDYIIACNASKIIDGYGSNVPSDPVLGPSCSEGDFCPDRSINRAEMAKMTMKAIRYRLDQYIQ